jgi:hypothetical protein
MRQRACIFCGWIGYWEVKDPHGYEKLSLLVYLMKNVKQLEERERFKTNVIGANVVLVDDWRPASDVMSDETYVDSSYDLALMKVAMRDRVDLTPIELEAKSNDDEDNREFTSALRNDDADDDFVDEDDDDD